MRERITEAGLRELEAGLDRQNAEAAAREEAIVSGKLARTLVTEVRRLRGLVDEAGRLQGINREREGRGFERLYSTLIDDEARAIAAER